MGIPIAVRIDKKFCAGEVEYPGETVEKRRFGICGVAAEDGAP
jgi:hypothetical protein